MSVIAIAVVPAVAISCVVAKVEAVWIFTFTGMAIECFPFSAFLLCFDHTFSPAHLTMRRVTALGIEVFVGFLPRLAVSAVLPPDAVPLLEELLMVPTMLCAGQQLQVTDVVIQSIPVFVVNVHPLRLRPVVLLPHVDMLEDFLACPRALNADIAVRCWLPTLDYLLAFSHGLPSQV